MKKILGALLSLLLLANSSLAIYAPRAIGMGGAFTAIADDASAAYWNPAGFAINPGIDFLGNYKVTNRNQQIGDNSIALKACFELGMNPFAWLAGVGLVSMFALEGAQYLADKGIVKKGWGRDVEAVSKEEPMAEGIKEEEKEKATKGETTERTEISKKQVAKQAVKEVAKGTIQVSKKLAKAAIQEAVRQSRHYYYAPAWYRPSYYRPTYWDNRYDYVEKELTPAGKAQFAGGITVMSDTNSSAGQNSNYYTLSLASGWGEIVALGANLNVYDLEITSVNPKIRGLGAGLDLGGLVRISDTLLFGLAIKELLTTDIKFDNGSSRRFEMSVNGGMALKPLRQVTVAADMHNIFGQNSQNATMHYGLEIKPVYGLALRAGSWDTNKTAGLSIGIEQLIIDYSYLGGAYNRSQTIGVTWKM